MISLILRPEFLLLCTPLILALNMSIEVHRMGRDKKD